MRGYYPYFDWLRFAAAATVVLGHSGANLGASGSLAVQVFFGLSGFLIGRILLHTDDLPHFFYNRVTRIWIPYYLSVAMLFGVAYFKDGLTERYFEFLFYDLTFVHDLFSHTPDMATAEAIMPMQATNNHYWSIAVEEQFYLVAPLLIVVFGVGRQLGFWIAAAVVFSVMGWMFGSLCAGVAAAVSLERYGNWHLPYRPLFGIAAVTLFAVILAYDARVLEAAFAVSAVLALATMRDRNPVGTLLGGASYSLYLNHWIAIFAVNLFFDGISAVTILLTLAVATLGAVVHYLVIDRTIQRHRGAFYTERRGRVMMYAGYGLVSLGLVVGSMLWGPPERWVVIGLGLSALWLLHTRRQRTRA